MSSGDTSRSKGEPGSGRDRHRDSQNGAPGGLSSNTQAQQEGSHGVGSLRSRIGEKEAPRLLPQAPPNSYRPDPPRKDDDRDGGRKRTISGMLPSIVSELDTHLYLTQTGTRM